MNRIDICKNIIQSIIQYITNTDVLEAHREKNHFIRNRKLSMFQVILYLLYSSKASIFQNLSSIRDDLPSLDLPSVSKQALSKARQFISPDLFKELFYLSVDQFYSQVPSRKLWHAVIIFSLLMVPRSSSPIPLPTLVSLVKCSVTLIRPDVLPWGLLEEIFISTDSSNKYRYQANRAFIIGRMKKILPKILCGIFHLPAIDRLFEDAIRCRSQILPGRTCRRKKSHTKGRTHFNNQKVAF